MAHSINLGDFFEQTVDPVRDGRYTAADRAPLIGTIVSNDSQLTSAISDGTAGIIYLEPGNYTAANIVTGLDRTANPLTIQSRYQNNKAQFRDVTQNIANTHHVTMKDLGMVNDGGLTSSDFFIYTGTASSTNGASNVKFQRLDFTNPTPADLNLSTDDPTYGDGIARLFRLSAHTTHNYEVSGCTGNVIYTFGDFTMNGNVLVSRNRFGLFYFDGMRIIGQRDEAYVDGNRIIEDMLIRGAIGRYEEIDGVSSPHPDFTQGFNSGGTNPRTRNTIFCRSVFNPGSYRGNLIQAGLTQTKMINVGYIDCMQVTKASPHGISLEEGGDGVLVERVSCVDYDQSSSPWVRIFKSDGQIKVKDSYFPGGINTTTGGNANLAGYELEEINNDSSTPYATKFANTPPGDTEAEIKAAFTPLVGLDIGALGSSGDFRSLSHIPMRASAPTVTGGSGTLTVDTINSPTLQITEQSDRDGDVYSRRDVRYSLTGAFSWTTQTDVQNGVVVTGLSAGTYDVQTRVVNAQGEGLWSYTQTGVVS